MKPYGIHIVAEFIYCAKKILNDKKRIEQALRAGLKKSGIGVVTISSHKFNPVGVTTIAIVTESHIAIHTYPEASHISLDIFTCSAEREKPFALLKFLRERFKPRIVRTVELQRGNPIEIKEKDWITSFTSSGFEIKYHIKKKLLSKTTKYQKIDIIENENFGRIMFLDKDIQIAEYDADLYNKAMILPLAKAKRKLNNVAILGGGDGGTLYEVLKYKPKKAVLIDIDKEVISAAKKYLPSICKDAFSQPNVEIINEDANKYLSTVHNFDAIVYDLTMHPEAMTKMHRFDFLDQLFSKIKSSLNKNGVISVQCCSVFDTDTMELLKKLFSKHFRDIKFTQTFIPSFCEYWVFATARVKK